MQLIKTQYPDNINYPDYYDLRDVIKLITNLQKELTFLKSRIGVQTKMIDISTSNAHFLVRMNDIICIKAESNYSKITLRNHPPVLVSKTLKYWQDILDSSLFFRCHRSFLVNITEISLVNINEGYLTISGQEKILLSRDRKKLLYHIFES